MPQSVIDDMRDIMPSKNLVIHEYRAHGTCSGLAPDQYFGLARDLYERVSTPQRFSAAGPLALSRGDRRGVSQSQSLAQAQHDRGELPGPEPTRRALLLRPRPVPEALWLE
jgi:ribonuclease I